VNANVTLTSIAGQTLIDTKNVNAIDISEYAPGIYFITLSGNNGQTIQRSKIVKE